MTSGVVVYRLKMLLGRDTELAHIDSLLGDARAAHRRVLGLVGTPGVGKTALCAYAVEQAPDMRVIRLRGALAEVELPLVGLADVVAALSDFVEFVPQKERALLVALKGRDANPEMDPMALGAATLSLLGTAADATPLLVVVDDAHWVDVPSLHALVFAWRRLDHDAVAVLVTARPPLPDALGAVVELIELAGLDVDSALDLVQGASTHHIAVDVARQLALLTGGNPLALSELPALLTRAQLNGAEPLPVPLPIGPRAVISLRALLGSLPRSTCLALAVVATAGPKGTQYLAPALEQLGLTTDDLAEAERAQLLTTIEGELTFRHGLVGTAAIDLVGPAQHRRIHSALAGAAALVDFERSVAHRYAAMLGTSEEIAKALDVVADSARQRGGAAASAPVLERAARASPPGPSRWARILRAVEAALIAGHPGNVRDLCEQLRAECDDATARGAATLLLGQSATWGEAPPGLKEDLWKLAKDANVAVSVPALMTLANMGLGRGDMPGLDEAVRALREVDISSAPHMSLHVDVFKAIGDTFCGNRETARALIERVAEIEAAPHTGPHGLAELTAETLNHVEEYETARALTTRSVPLAWSGVPTSVPARQPRRQLLVARRLAPHDRLQRGSCRPRRPDRTAGDGRLRPWAARPGAGRSRRNRRSPCPCDGPAQTR